MPNESTQTITPTECEHGQEDAKADCPVCVEKAQTYISNWGKEREKPRDKMRRRAEDK